MKVAHGRREKGAAEMRRYGRGVRGIAEEAIYVIYRKERYIGIYSIHKYYICRQAVVMVV